MGILYSILPLIKEVFVDFKEFFVDFKEFFLWQVLPTTTFVGIIQLN